MPSRPRQAALRSAPGLRYTALEGLTVIDPVTMTPVPADGATLGEVMFHGNIVMKGYTQDPQATAQAFAGGIGPLGDSTFFILTATSGSRTAPRTSSSPAADISSIEVTPLYRHRRRRRLRRRRQARREIGRTIAFIELKPGVPPRPP